MNFVGLGCRLKICCIQNGIKGEGEKTDSWESRFTASKCNSGTNCCDELMCMHIKYCNSHEKRRNFELVETI